MMTSKRLLAVAVSAALYAPLSAFATNGMMMEGYGPIATGGGASMAYDNGTAAMMNNPATLGLMAHGSRLDIAVGLRQPDVTWDMGAGGSYSSASDSFMMPAIGWVKKSGAMAYGVGVFAQGPASVVGNHVEGTIGSKTYAIEVWNASPLLASNVIVGSTSGAGFSRDCEKRCLLASQRWLLFELTADMVLRSPLAWAGLIHETIKARMVEVGDAAVRAPVV